MATKTHDITVKIGEYTDRDGNTKGRWLNVGSVMKNDEGGTFALLHRHVNLAGIPNPDNRDSVIASVFPVDKGDKGGNKQEPQQQAKAPASDVPDDDIPF